MKTIALGSLLLCFSALIVQGADTGYIQVKSPPGITIFLDGNFKGKTSSDFGGIILEEVPAGRHVIKAVKIGFTPKATEVIVEADSVKVWEVGTFTARIRISETEEVDREVLRQPVGYLVVQSVPVEMSLSIPQLGVNHTKRKNRLTLSEVPVGKYLATFSSLSRKIHYEIIIADEKETELFVNLLKGVVTNKTEERLAAAKKGEEERKRIAAQLMFKENINLGDIPSFPLSDLSLHLPGTDPETDPFFPGVLATPKGSLDPTALTNLIRKQREKPSLEIIEQLGGSDATERAIGLALQWLARNQEPDGRWDIRKHGGNGSYETAGVGLALLCFYGWDATHQKPGKFQNTVKKALKWLVNQQKENGDLSSSAAGNGRMYSHGIAAIALCEAYGLTKDPALKEPAEKAIKLIVASQDPNKGGWRYNPRPGDSDTSVTGWQYMALHSARMAGIEVDESVFVNARRWFDHAGGGRHGGLYGYTGPQNNNQVMTATGMFCRQLDLVPPTDLRMPESAQALKMRPINVNNPAYCYLYYGTLALYQHQGPIWTDWNEKMKETLPRLQNKNGNEAGSWDKGAGHAASGGRVVSTTLATLSLEVYYRLLPMYGFRNKAVEAPALKLKNK